MGCVESEAKLPTKVIRVALIGDRGCGKSALISAFLMRKFETGYSPSTSGNIGVKAYTFRNSPEVITLEVWELNEVRSVPASFSHVILAIDAALPLNTLRAHVSQYIEKLGLQRRMPTLAVVITKADTVVERPEERLYNIKKALGLPNCVRMFITSAESMYGVDEMFKEAVKPEVASQSVSRATSLAG